MEASPSASGVSPVDAPVLAVDLEHTFPGGFRLRLAFESAAKTLALFGPSGSGKSTLLNIVAGLLQPQRGKVVLQGQVLLDTAARQALPPRRRGVGLVLQDGLLFPLLSVRENLLFGAPPRGACLSLQRVALGRAALSEPRLLLCDEPFASLDEARRRRLVPILGRIRELLGIPLVLISHNPREVEALAEEVLLLAEGALRAQGPPSELLPDRVEEGGAPSLLP